MASVKKLTIFFHSALLLLYASMSAGLYSRFSFLGTPLYCTVALRNDWGSIQVLNSIHIPVLVVGVTSDPLYPVYAILFSCLVCFLTLPVTYPVYDIRFAAWFAFLQHYSGSATLKGFILSNKFAQGGATGVQPVSPNNAGVPLDTRSL